MKRIIFFILISLLHTVAVSQCYEPNLQKADAAYARGDWQTAYNYYRNASKCPDAKRFENGKLADAGMVKCQPVLTVDGEKDVVVYVVSGAGNKSFRVKNIRLSLWRVATNYRGYGLELTPDVSTGVLAASWNANTQPTPREFEITIWGEGGVSDAKATIRIIQAKSELTINGQTSLEKTFSWEGGAARFDVSGISAGQDYTVSGVDASWMSIQKKTDHFFLIVTANDSKVSGRTKAITVSRGNQTVNIQITQSDCSGNEDLKAKSRISLGKLKIAPSSAVPFKKGIVSGFINYEGEIFSLSSSMRKSERYNFWSYSIKNSEREGKEHRVWDLGLYPINNSCSIRVVECDEGEKESNARFAILYSNGENGVTQLERYRLDSKKCMMFHRFDNEDFIITYGIYDYTELNQDGIDVLVDQCLELRKYNGTLIHKDYTSKSYKNFFFENGIAIRYTIWTGRNVLWQWYVIKRDGTKVKMPKSIDWVEFITEETIGFRDKDNRRGFCSLDGEIIIRPQFYYIFPFSEGFAQVYKDDEWFFVDKKGNRYFDDKNLNQPSRSFSDGLAAVIGSDYTNDDNQKTICFINKSGNVQLCLRGSDYSFDNYSTDIVFFTYLFRESVAVAKLAISGRDKYCLINKSGGRITDMLFDYLTPMINGLSVAKYNGVTVLVNRKGEIYNIPRLKANNFSFNMDETLTLFDENYCLSIDSLGNYFNGMNPEMISIGSTSVSPTVFSVNGVVGYFNDTLGVVTVPPRFNEGLPFSENLAAVKVNSRWGFIDEKGKLVIPTIFELAKPFSNGRAEVVIDGKTYYIDKKGTILEE